MNRGAAIPKELELTDTEKAIFDAAARSIVTGEAITLDLHFDSLNHSWYAKDKAVVRTLADRVEFYSSSVKTVRRADKNLFDGQVLGNYSYLAVCNVGNPEEVITEIESDVTLLGVGPYKDGFNVSPTPTTLEERAKRRAWAAKMERKQREQAAGEQVAADFATRLKEGVAAYAQRADAATTQYLEAEYLKYRMDTRDVAAACQALGIDFYGLVHEVAAEMLAERKR